MRGFPHWGAGGLLEIMDTMQSTSDPKLGERVTLWWLSDSNQRISARQTDGKACTSKNLLACRFGDLCHHQSNDTVGKLSSLTLPAFPLQVQSKHLSSSSETERKHFLSRDHPSSACGKDTELSSYRAPY